MRWTVLATLSVLLIGFISDVASAPRSVVVTLKERSPVPGMSMERFLYSMNDADKPLAPKPNRIDVPSPLKDKPPPKTNFDWQCSGDLGWW
jgi:hypothetical protein